MQVPKLRFKEFNDEWISAKLRNLGNTYTGLSGKSKEDFKNGNSKFITYMNVFSNCISNNQQLGNINIASNETQNKVKYGDIFFTTSSETPKEVGMSSVWLFNDDNIYLNSFCFGFRLNNITNFNIKFLAYLLRSNLIRKKIIFLAQGSTRYNISKNELMKLEILYPSIEEQTKIGDFLSLIDRKIELQEKLVENLKLYKKGLLQKVFSNNQEWNHVELYTVCDVRDGTHNSPKYTENGYPLVTSKNLSKNGQLDFSNISYISQKDFDEINKRSKVNVGDILFGMIGTIGNPVLLTKDEFAIKNVALIKEKTKLKNKFLIQFLNSSAIENQFNFNKTGGTQKFIALNSIRKLLVPIPSIEEQNRIANLFTSLDKKIELETKKLQDLKTYKKGLLQKMFI